MKKVNKPLNGSTNWPMKKQYSHFKNVKTIEVQSQILQAHSTQHLKSKKIAPNVKMKDDIQKTIAHHLPSDP